MHRPTRSRLLTTIPVVLVVLVVAGTLLVWAVLVHDARSHVVGDAARPGWRTIELDGVRVDLPASWERTSRRGCEFGFERWAPSTDRGCRGTVGVSFYASATFDPAVGPGDLRRWREGGRSGWAGWAEAGDLAVDVAGPDRTLVRQVLASVRRAG